MAKCGTATKSHDGEVLSYSLKDLSSREPPRTFEALEAWLSANSKRANWDGKLYVASTIYWDSSTKEFQQTGCSPNYRAGWWSLACCKHDMRTARPFRDKAIDLSVPTYVFTFASINAGLGQPLVSIAQVTKHCFATMKEYAEFLRGKNDAALISSRCTRRRRNDEHLGWRFGDCHANFNGKVGEPHRGHVHYSNESWKDDINGKHMILVSDRYLLWPQPAFVASATQNQSRYGKDVDQGTCENC